MGDAVLDVEGRLISLNDKPLSECTLGLHMASNNDLVEKIRIKPMFQDYFVVAPKKESYYVDAECKGGRTGRSETFVFDPPSNVPAKILYISIK